MKVIKNPLRLLVIRPKRDTCKAFYAKFKTFDVDYLDIGNVNNLSFYLIKGLKKHIEEADVVCISDNYYIYNLQAVFWSWYFKKPVVTILWATIPNHISSWLPPYSFVTRAVVKYSSLFILRNKSALQFAKSLNIPDRKIRVIYKGVDLDHFRPSGKRKSNSINILYVGKLIKSKGVCDLVSVFELLHKKYKNVSLDLVGEGYLKEWLKNKKGIKVLGSVGYDRLPGVYKIADIFCSPSRQIKFFGLKIWEEYFSYVLMEAQASGLPIVCTKSVGVVEEVNQRNEIIDQEDRERLFDSLEKLILDSKLREKLSKINRERARRYFNASIQAEKTEKVILNYVKKRGKLV